VEPPRTKEAAVTSRGLQNLQVVRKLFDAMGSGDLGTLRQLLSDDVTLVIPGSFRLAGKFKGPDEFLRGFGQLAEASAGTLRVELVSTAVNGLDGDQVLATYHATGTVKNEAIDEQNACLVRLADGRVSEMIDFYGDPQTVARQWD
jgi:ketosteroid isomerase-like protein